MTLLPLFLACSQELIPGERVLGADLPVEAFYGEEGDLLGWTVAGAEGAWMGAAPGGEYSLGLGLAGETVPRRTSAPARWVGVWEGRLIQAAPEGLYLDGALVWDDEPITSMAVGPSIFVTTATELLALSTEGEVRWSAPARGARGIAVGVDRVVVGLCGERCEVRGWTLGGQGLGTLLDAGRHGAIAEWSGLLWAGDPMWEEDLGRGRVCNEVGVCIEGEPGDHLGVGIGGGYAAGVFNRHLTPQRARIVPLVAAGPVLVLETGAEGQVLSLAGDEETLVIGAPHQAHGGAVVGAMFLRHHL